MKAKLILVLFFSIAVAACGGGGGGGGNSGGATPISATATTAAQSLTVGTAMTSFSPLTPSGGATPYTYSYTGTLPAGLSFNTSNGAVSGTPTAIYTTANLVFSAQDANNVVASTTSTVSFTVLPTGYVVQGGLTWMPVTSFYDTWTNANAYCANTTINGQTGWRQPTETELSALYASGAMYGQGWTLNLTWSSTVYSAGSHYRVNLNGGDVLWTYDMLTSLVSCVRTVGAAGPISATATTTAQSLTVGTAMASFSPLTASGGATPYTYSYTGTLPAGLSFNTSTDAVTGTPTAPYTTANLVFSVRDANNNYASTTSTVSFTVSAASALPAGYVVQGGLTWMPVTFSDTWANANAYCANTTINGQTGWRMPTETELRALYTSGAMNGQGWTLDYTWSSTFYSAGFHASVSLNGGLVPWYNDTYNLYVSCVRTVGAAGPISATATTTAQSLTVGTAMASFSPLTARGGTTPYTYSYTGIYTSNYEGNGVFSYMGTLPAGLSFDTSTGAVTGTPTAVYTSINNPFSVIYADLVFSVKDANNVVARTTSTVRFNVNAYVDQGGLTWMPVMFSDNWANANAYCANTTINGQTGWRLPTQTELSALYTSRAMYGKGWGLGDTWSSTPNGTGYHFFVGLNNYGGIYWTSDMASRYVTCVR